MDDMHAAFQALGPIDFETLPANNPDELRAFVCDLLTKALQLADSVPPPPGDGSTPAESTGSTPDIAAWSKKWGKPINKTDKSKENPLGIPMYKLSSKDKGGSWFGRRSVHEGLPFERWKEKMHGELQETVKMRERNGNDLATGSIRGIGCEKQLERIEVPITQQGEGKDATDGGGEVSKEYLAVIEIYHLSASFQGPSTPRDFVSLRVTSDRPYDASGADAKMDTNGSQATGSSPPRTYIVATKPCKHPDAAPRKGFIRGEYESIEMIREIPGNDTEANSNEEAIRPIEWIMVTRSDPGGSIPRWMIDRGTPPSILGDAKKFVDWAYHDKLPHAGHANGIQNGNASPGETQASKQPETNGTKSPAAGTVGAPHDNEEREFVRLVEGVAGLALLGLERIVPRSFQQYLSARCQAMRGRALEVNAMNREVYTRPYNQTRRTSSQSSLQGAESDTDVDALSTESTAADGPRNKELSKIDARMRKVEEELEAVRQERGGLGRENLPEQVDGISSPAEGQDADEAILHPQKGPSPAQVKRLKALETKETKLVSKFEKLVAQRRKAVANIDAKQRKEAEKNERRNAQAEVGKLKEETTQLKKEVAELRQEREKWLDLVGRLQKENTALVAESQNKQVAR